MAITDETASAPDNVRFCAHCGHLAGQARFCPGCGQAIDASAGASGTAVAPPPPLPRRSHTALIVAGGALGLVAIALAAIVLLTSSSGSDPNATYRQKLTAALAPVLAANTGLSSSLQSLHGNDAQPAQNAARQAQSAITAARGATAAITVPSSSAQLSQQVQQALTQESGYLQSVSSTLSSPAADNISQLQPLATSASSALIPLGGVAPGAGTSLNGNDALSAWASGRIAAAARTSAAAARKAQQHAVQQAASKAAQQTAAKSTSGVSPGTSAAATPTVGPSPSGCNCGVQDLPVQCGYGLAASSGTTCTFANNAFYEYWQAGGGNPNAFVQVGVWSSLAQLYYPLSCDSGDGVVDCTDSTGDDVRFTQTSVTLYDSSQAATYAASGKLGPNG